MESLSKGRSIPQTLQTYVTSTPIGACTPHRRKKDEFTRMFTAVASPITEPTSVGFCCCSVRIEYSFGWIMNFGESANTNYSQIVNQHIRYTISHFEVSKKCIGCDVTQTRLELKLKEIREN